MPRSEQERLALRIALSRSFSPGAPISKLELFAGRGKQIEALIHAVSQRGLHAMVYGERGVGKTSLANVLEDILAAIKEPGWVFTKVNCDATDNYSSLWGKVLREFSFTRRLRNKIGFQGDVQFEQLSFENLLPESNISPDDVRYALSFLKEHAVIIVDEFDRIADDATKTLIADTIKTLSDYALDITMVLVGVGDSVQQLITEHRSIERSLIQILMPRMSDAEVSETLNKCLKSAGMTAEPEVRHAIARISQYLPHYVHLLGLNAGEVAIEHDRERIVLSDLKEAVDLATKRSLHSLGSDYYVAVKSARTTSIFSQVLLACAMAKTDDLGFFTPSDVRGPLSEVMGKNCDIANFQRHLNEFTSEKRAKVLQKRGETRNFRYRFSNPLLGPYILLRGIADELISSEKLLSL